MHDSKNESSAGVVASEVISHEEAIFLVCDGHEQAELLQIGVSISHNPHATITLDIPEDYYQRSFILEFGDFGFIVKSVDDNRVLAYNTFNKHLGRDFDDIDIEFIRGLAAMALIQLEYRINHKAYIYDVIFSPHFTEFLHRCKDWLKARNPK